jgi:hypothetical protein
MYKLEVQSLFLMVKGRSFLIKRIRKKPEPSYADRCDAIVSMDDHLNARVSNEFFRIEFVRCLLVI